MRTGKRGFGCLLSFLIGNFLCDSGTFRIIRQKGVFLMRRIKQLDSTGCGIACVAMIAGRTYSQVRKIAVEMGYQRSDLTLYTHAKQLRALLDHFGVRTERARMARHWESLSATGIAAVNRRESDGRWHWVVYQHGRRPYAIDPRKSAPPRRTDFGRLRLHSFVPISVKQA